MLLVFQLLNHTQRGRYLLFLYSQANCIDSTAKPEVVFAGEIDKLREDHLKPSEQVSLEPYERDHAVV